MCIGIWTLEHPDYALIICANRDEFLDRPTQNAQFHSFGVDPDQHPVLSGRDELAGGSWFGINRRTGNVALLTNITEPSKHYNTSRGNLVSSFLLSSNTSEDQVRNNIVPVDDDDDDAKLAGFNLLLLTPTTTLDDLGINNTTSMLRYESLLVTNHGGGGSVTSRTLTSSERSCGALSNGIDGTDAHLWPKVQHATAHFPVVVKSSRSTDPTDVELVEHLFQLLAWQPQDCTISQQSELSKTVQVSPMPLSTVSGNLSYKGTRLSTILLVRNNGQVLFIERDIWKLGDGGVPVKSEPPGERKYNFQLDLTAGNRSS